MSADFNRWDILAAYNVYSCSWGWDVYTHGIQRRLSRLRWRDRSGECLEDLSENAKRIYGGLERRHQGHTVAYNRLRRRRPNVFPPWPGLQHVRSYRDFVRSLGVDPACLDMVAPS